jgi:hypothetical protein
MHKASADRSMFPKHEVFFSQYAGYITTVEGPKMSDDQLAEIQQKIVEVAV